MAATIHGNLLNVGKCGKLVQSEKSARSGKRPPQGAIDSDISRLSHSPDARLVRPRTREAHSYRREH